MMRVIIHGGMHKTATTSLQGLMASNRQLMREHGVHYPQGTLDHQHGHELNCKSPDWTPDWCRTVVQEARELGCNTLFLSGEVVSTLSSAQLRKLRVGFPNEEVTFVYCFRHWNQFLPSRWVQNNTRRDTQSFEDYLELINNSGIQSVDLFFDKVITNALSFDNCRVIAVSYQNSLASSSSVIDSVLAAASLPNPLIRALQSLPRLSLNSRSPWLTSEAARLLNGVVADRHGLPQNELCLITANHGNLSVAFDLIAKFPEVPSDLMAELYAIIERHRTDKVITSIRGVESATDRLQERHSHHFCNLMDGRIFAQITPGTLTCSDMNWQDLERDHRSLVDAILGRITAGDAGSADSVRPHSGHSPAARPSAPTTGSAEAVGKRG